ncbi:MSHA biogenesis protein MshP [Vibrio sp. FNV 38]|nr:MSHA biogenesis protein MshP [Vibrio sp. FNV 38]
MYRSRRKQQGSVLIVAVFVIVVMGMMAAALNRIQWSNQDSHVREVNGTHAWLAATSATEWALTEVYPLNSTIGSCSIGALPLIFERCSSVTTTCSNLGSLGENTYFKITSIAECGTGIHAVERRHEVWGRE